MSNVKLFQLTAIILNVFVSYATPIHPRAQIQLAPQVTPPNLDGTESTPSHEIGLEEDRIIGGVPTTAKEFPYMVDLRFQGKHVCAGSYILPLWVLTAAHCLITYKVRILNCFMGMTFLQDTMKAQMRNSSGIYPHEDYYVGNDTNDIGLIQLTSEFQENDSVGMIALAAGPVSTTTLCKVSGWGITNQADMRDFTKLSSQLRYTEVPIMAQQQCGSLYFLERYQAHFRGVKVFCAGYLHGGHDACQGDSGGPLVCDGLQVGLVSWGIGCGSDLPGVYTNVTTFSSWIKATVARAKRNVEIKDDSGTDLPLIRSISNILIANLSRTIMVLSCVFYFYL